MVPDPFNVVAAEAQESADTLMGMSGLTAPAGGQLRPAPAAGTLGSAPAADWSAAAEERRFGFWRGRALVLAAGDAAAVIFSMGVARAVSSRVPWGETLLSPRMWLGTALVWSLLCVGLFAAHGLYGRSLVRISPGGTDELREIFDSLVLGAGLLLVVDQVCQRVTGNDLLGPTLAIGFALCALALVPLARTALRHTVIARYWRCPRAVVVGSGMVAELMYAKLGQESAYSIELVGFVDDDPGSGFDGCPYLGRRDSLPSAVEELGIDRVLVAYSTADHQEALDLLRSVRREGVQISIVPRYFEAFTAGASLDDVDGIPVITLPPLRLGREARLLKRTFDILVSGALVLVLAPLLLAIGLAIRLDSRGPALFRQARRGRAGEVFQILKFRSMTTDAEARRFDLAHLNEVDGPLFKVKGRDPRVTRIGTFLRRTSLDELPQLWNVLKGDMSLVGPRPFVLHEADRITGWATKRLEVSPGLTGLWQTLGRNDLAYDEMVKLDYLYVTNWSLWWDIRILARTLPAVVRRSGAY